MSGPQIIRTPNGEEPVVLPDVKQLRERKL
jgi:hypothetical protein